MRTPLVAAITALLGFILGWSLHGGSVHERIHTVVPPAPGAVPIVRKTESPFPERPKPPLDSPQPVLSASSAPLPTSSSPLVGDLPKLPPAMPETAPLTPAKPLPTADLNADEALARRVVLGIGGEIVSSADAQDAGGKVGRSLVAEIAPDGLSRLRTALRQALGSRAVISDGGAVSGSSTEVRKAEDELTALKKQLQRAQDDFLPNAPALRNVEDAYREGERNLAEVRKTYARQQLNILLRSSPVG